MENVVDIALKMRQFGRFGCCEKNTRIDSAYKFFVVCLSKCDIVWETNWKEWCEESELATENPLPKSSQLLKESTEHGAKTADT